MTSPATGTKRKVVELLAFARFGAASRAKPAAAFNMLRRRIALLPFGADHREAAAALPS